jgi:hypothetical protein
MMIVEAGKTTAENRKVTIFIGEQLGSRRYISVMQSADRYVVRRHPQASNLWDVIDTMRGGEVVFGGDALTEGQARAMAATLSRHYRDWREGR